MKKMKKIVSLMLAMVMVLGMSVTAFAADTTYSITINNDAKDHIYEAYQIFTGDLATSTDDEGNTTKILSNVVWGANANQTGAVSKDTLDALTIQNAKTYVNFNSTPVGSTSTQTDGKYVISGLAAGYYLVKDKDGTLADDDDAYTEYIIKVVGDVTTDPKSDVPEVQKKVKDTNDSEADSTTDWQDSADYDIGDSVPFELTATLADNVSAYNTYKIVFHDTLSSGLTYNNDAKVMFGETDVTSYFTITEDNGILTISCDNVKVFGATDSSVIKVDYTATLNTNAAIGSVGNPNTVYLEYSNNPNQTGEGTPETGKTPDDKVIVFTYRTVVNKVQKNPDYDPEVEGSEEYISLEGAGFTLYKYDADATTEDKWVAVGSEVKGDKMTQFTWSGLDDGKYKLVETTTPNGYNTIAPIEFTITADHEVTAENPALTGLSVDNNNFTVEMISGSTIPTGNISTDVVNQKGSELPETGGMGTTIFYIVGAILVIGAAVVLIARKRMSAER